MSNKDTPFVCPNCGEEHDRSWVESVTMFRCMGCGRNIRGELVVTAAEHLSDSVDHFTPSCIVEPARALLGEIDLDPATSEQNPTRATRFFTAADNGFTEPWVGKVFLNCPGGSCDENGVVLVKDKARGKGWFRSTDGTPAKPHSAQRLWWFKLMNEYLIGRVEAAVFVCFKLDLLQTTQVNTPAMFMTCLPLDFMICFPSKRIDYLKMKDGELKAGGAPPHASAVIYIHPGNEPPGNHHLSVVRENQFLRFKEHFGKLGRCISRAW